MRIDEALRYGGFDPSDAQAAKQAEIFWKQIEQKHRPKTVWRVFDLEKTEDGFKAGNLVLQGKSAEVMLKNCTQVIAGAMTLGPGLDLEISRMQLRNMKDALLYDGCANAVLENELDLFCDRLHDARFPNLHFTDRFSCGYGDLPLALQKEIETELDLPRRIGVHVTDSLMCHPCKTVTYFIGISQSVQPARIRGCAYCALKGNCAFRKRGTFCGS